MSVEQLVSSMTPEIYVKLQTAVELGKWEDGTTLTAGQKANALQAVMLYQSRYNKNPEHFTIGTDGEITMIKKSVLKNQYKDEIIRVELE